MSSEKKQLKILLVEDQKVAMIVHRRMLEEMGYTPDLAVTGEEAVSLSYANNYDLIFMDIALPGISGIEATVQIRLQEKGKTPAYIVALTAYELADIQEECTLAGMDMIKSKPISSDEIQEIIHYTVLIQQLAGVS